MQLSNNTLKVLSNFSLINPGMIFAESNKQTTITPLNTLVAQATLEEVFPKRFALYDLDGFLKYYKLIPNAELDFKENYVRIYNDSKEFKFFYSDEVVIIAPKKEPYDHDEEDLRFEISDNELNTLRMAYSYSKNLKHLKIWDNDGNLCLSIVNNDKDAKNRATNEFNITIRPLTNNDITGFTFFVPMENLLILDGDYEFVISKISRNNNNVVVLRLENKTYLVKYWTSMEGN